MSYPVRCPHCGALLNAEPNWAGMQSTCPNCKQALTIPPPPVSEVVNDGAAPNVHVQNDAPTGKDYSGQAISAFFISLFCCGIVGLIMAINASGKMKASGNMHGHGWITATYVAFVINLIVSIVNVVLALGE